MSNHAMLFAIEDVETIVAAQEILYMRRLLAKMRRFIDESPAPPPPPPPGSATMPISLVQDDLDKVHELETLRARYVRRVHVDPECARAVAKICRENAEAVAGISKAEKQELP